MTHERTTIGREVAAIQIPDGIEVTIPAGDEVWIVQELGGSFTIMTDRGAMFRIDERNADALGKEPPADRSAELQEGALEDRVWAQVDGFERIWALADEGLERDNEEKTSAVHFMRFELSAEMVAAARAGADISMGVQHEVYTHSVDAIPSAIRAFLGKGR